MRSLCSLRFGGSFEYLIPLILEALKDLDAYVRKTAIMGVVKVYYMQPDVIASNSIFVTFFFFWQESESIDYLYKMIKDNDPLVIINAI